MRTVRRGRKTRAPGWLRQTLKILGGASASAAVSISWMTYTSWNLAVISPTGYLTMWGWTYGPFYAFLAAGVAVTAFAFMSTLVVGDNYKELEASFSRYVAAVFKEDREQNIDFIPDAVELIKERIAAYGSVTSTARPYSSESVFRSKWKLYTGSIQFKEYVDSSKQFLERLQGHVWEEVVHNAYPRAAVTQLSEELKIVVMRGLSDIYDVTVPDEEERFVSEVACTIKHGRQTELADDVMYMCVSYRHQSSADKGRIVKKCTRSNSRMRCTCQDVPEHQGRKDMAVCSDGRRAEDVSVGGQTGVPRRLLVDCARSGAVPGVPDHPLSSDWHRRRPAVAAS
ncbi:hypothetical protein FGB62_347g010 [Gracilaria domingensis]|nr:hypothetical protein FGB62_347g010 [Gracilaria domingensis]